MAAALLQRRRVPLGTQPREPETLAAALGTESHNRGFWLVAGSTGPACVLLVAAYPLQRPDEGDSIGHAEDTLRVAQAAAQHPRLGGLLRPADAVALAAADPHTYREGPSASTGLDDVSIATGPNSWAASGSGAARGPLLPPPDGCRRCLYGVGTVCTGSVAMHATDQAGSLPESGPAGKKAHPTARQTPRPPHFWDARPRSGREHRPELRGELHRTPGVRAATTEAPVATTASAFSRPSAFPVASWLGHVVGILAAPQHRSPGREPRPAGGRRRP